MTALAIPTQMHGMFISGKGYSFLGRIEIENYAQMRNRTSLLAFIMYVEPFRSIVVVPKQ